MSLGINFFDGKIGKCFTINVNKSCRGCNKNLAGNDPASIHQKQKIIQKAVRINSSLYTMNLSGLHSYQSPLSRYQAVEQSGTPYVIPPNTNWNQMSDRVMPSNQRVKTGSGSTYGANSLKCSKVRNRPGAMSPGGIGVDIKHNSYERRLNKLKGKALLRQGNSQVAIEQQMQGGKILRHGIVNGCYCEQNQSKYYANNIKEFNDAMYDINLQYKVGQTILVRKNMYNKLWYKGIILNINSNIYVIDFGNENIEQIDVTNVPILPYFRKNTDCLYSEDPTDLLSVLDNSEICAKQALLEAGVLI